MKPAELEAELASGRIRPAYLVVGEEPLLRDEALEALRQAVLDPGSEDFNFDRLEGESVRPAALFDALGMLPVMADRRLVILREPEAARGGGKALTEALAEAVPALAGGAETVLVVAAAKVDRRSRWFKAFRDPAAEVRCDPPKPGRETLAFVREEAKRQGVLLGKGAAELLAERVGPALLLLRREIEKASLLTEPGGKVTREQVAAQRRRSRRAREGPRCGGGTAAAPRRARDPLSQTAADAHRRQRARAAVRGEEARATGGALCSAPIAILLERDPRNRYRAQRRGGAQRRHCARTTRDRP
ncbi:MAG: DNA polymerase III subunit delta [Deltaproteobacteria bacterium]|nr:DNA polymerase III subunit delta [Deltaproteobacteria bacterium]